MICNGENRKRDFFKFENETMYSHEKKIVSRKNREIRKNKIFQKRERWSGEEDQNSDQHLELL